MLVLDSGGLSPCRAYEDVGVAHPGIDSARVVATAGSHVGARRVAARRCRPRCRHQAISEDVHHRVDRQRECCPPGCRTPPTCPYRLGCRRAGRRNCRTRRHSPHRTSNRHRGACRSRRSRQRRSHLTQHRACPDGGSRPPVCVAPRQRMHQPDERDRAAGQRSPNLKHFAGDAVQGRCSCPVTRFRTRLGRA